MNRFGEHKGSYCIVAKHRDGRQEDYIDTINIEELEKKTIERNHNVIDWRNIWKTWSLVITVFLCLSLGVIRFNEFP